MIQRIVKMTFDTASVPQFMELFAANKAKIRTFKGCRYLELLQDRDREGVYFTRSLWDSVDDLEAYRESEQFRNVWTATRRLFTEPPKAWSLNQIDSLK